MRQAYVSRAAAESASPNPPVTDVQSPLYEDSVRLCTFTSPDAVHAYQTTQLVQQ